MIIIEFFTIDFRIFVSNVDLGVSDVMQSFVNKSNIAAAEEYINSINRIKPNIKNTKLQNSIGILNWIKQYNKTRQIQKVVWGYREKPKGVPSNHSGDIFLVFKDQKVNPKILGVSLKAGTKSSKEPKLNLSPNNFEQNIIVNKSYNKDIVNVSDLELKSHKEFLKKELKKNFY